MLDITAITVMGMVVIFQKNYGKLWYFRRITENLVTLLTFCYISCHRCLEYDTMAELTLPFLSSGFCHEQCIISSTIKRNDEVELLITCKQCCHTKTLPQTESSNESPTSPLLLQGQESRDAITASKGAKQKRCNQSLTSVCHLESPLEIKSAMHDSSVVPINRRKLCSWGLIWKKNKPEKNGVDFRMTNILLRGNSDMSRSGDSGPICHLCSNPYNSNLTYICCETCTSKPALRDKSPPSSLLCVFSFLF